MTIETPRGPSANAPSQAVAVFATRPEVQPNEVRCEYELSTFGRCSTTVYVDPAPITLETSRGPSINVPGQPLAVITTRLEVAEAEVRRLAAQLQVESSTARRESDTARAESNTSRRELFDIVHRLWRAEERATAAEAKIFELTAKVEELTRRQNNSEHAK